MRNNFLRHNLTYHILAALLALVLWSYVKTADLASRTDVSKAFSDVALEVRNVATSLQVTSALPQAITVTIRGLPSVTDQVTRQDILAFVDLQNAVEGTGQFVIKVQVPPGLSAVASPSRLEVKLEQVLTVDVGLQATGDRVVQNDHLLVVGVDPQFVRITGVRSQLELVTRATVQTDWARATTGVGLSLPVQLLDASGQEIKGPHVEPSVAAATVSRLAGKVVDVVVPTVGQLPAGYQLVGVQATPPSFTLFGSSSALANLQSVSPAPISLDGLTANATISLALILPDGVLTASTSQVQVTVQIKP